MIWKIMLTRIFSGKH